MALLVAVATFLIATVVFLTIWLSMAASSPQKVIRQRMEAVHKAEQRGVISEDLALVRDETYSSVPLLHRVLMRLSWTSRLRDFIAQAGMSTRPAKILLWTGVLGLGAYVASTQFLHLRFLGLFAGIAGAAIPVAIVALKRRKRLREFEELFPEALDLLGRAVRAGHAFTTGLEMIAKESPELLAAEFRKTFEERNFGLPMRDALINLAERVPLVDVRFFVTALLVQKETGGNLAGILDELARLIRDRFRIHREVQVKTAQGRLTAMILIGLPIVMLIVLELTNPRYVNVLFTDPSGPLVLGAAAALQVLGSLIIWKIVHIEV
ncbi:MAG: type II secretion system F family protein [Candidatus Acidiferrales bacterium]